MRALVAMSGGVDSSVAAALMIGSKRSRLSAMDLESRATFASSGVLNELLQTCLPKEL